MAAKREIRLAYSTPDNCSGNALLITQAAPRERYWRSVFFGCRPTGQAIFDVADGTVPADVREAVESHCNNNCRSAKWRRSPYARGGRGFLGCGYSRRRK